MIELNREDQVPGSGILTAHFSPGTKLSLRDAIHLMIVYIVWRNTNPRKRMDGLRARIVTAPCPFRPHVNRPAGNANDRNRAWSRRSIVRNLPVGYDKKAEGEFVARAPTWLANRRDSRPQPALGFAP